MPTHDEIFQKVQATLVDALGVDEEDVTRDATLQGDLGAESIDFLDIVFRLERNFGIKIPRGELFPENVVADPEMIEGGKLTAKGLDELKTRMPYADLPSFAADPEVDKIGDLYTVDMLVQYVQSKLRGLTVRPVAAGRDDRRRPATIAARSAPRLGPSRPVASVVPDAACPESRRPFCRYGGCSRSCDGSGSTSSWSSGAGSSPGPSRT